MNNITQLIHNLPTGTVLTALEDGLWELKARKNVSCNDLVVYTQKQQHSLFEFLSTVALLESERLDKEYKGTGGGLFPMTDLVD